MNRIIIDHYGHDLVMKKNDDGEYLRFIIPGMVDEDGDDVGLFHKNAWGMLWAYDMDLVKKIQNMFGFDLDEIKYYLAKYFETKYDIKIKSVSISDNL